MKKQSLITILLTVLMSMTGIKAFAYDFYVANNDGISICYRWTNEARTELSVSFRSTMIPVPVPYGNMIIPESVNFNGKTYPVTSIGNQAFKDCFYLTSVTIPNSVTSIGDAAFDGCSGLTSVTIPNSVTSIGDGVFSGCSGLTSVTIPNSVKYIGYHAFLNCSGLTSVTIGNSMKYIGQGAFYGCSGLTSVTIPNSVTYIDHGAFYGCSGLTSITIGSGVIEINTSAFGKCNELTDFYCLAGELGSVKWSEESLYTEPNAFEDPFYNVSYLDHVTLHVPAASIEAYRTTKPWNQFKTIVALKSGDIPTIRKCATPEINYANGKVSLSCETKGVKFISEVTVADAKKHYDSEFTLFQTYKISVYATKAGYENSNVATREIVIENGQTSLFGDLNKDGKVNVADHVKLSDIIMK